MLSDSHSSPDISTWIKVLQSDLINNEILIPQENCADVLEDIYKSLTNNDISRKEGIFRLVDELPDFFIKVNAAITLDAMNRCKLAKNQNLNGDDHEFLESINALEFSSDPESKNTYEGFLKKSADLIRSINRDIDNDEEYKKGEQKQEMKIFYKTMNSKLFEEADRNSYIQIIHFALFSSDIKVLQKIIEYRHDCDFLVEVNVPIKYYKARSYEKPSDKSFNL